MSGHVPEPKNFEPKTPVSLNPPKDDPISADYLAQCDGVFTLTLTQFPRLRLDFSYSSSSGRMGERLQIAGVWMLANLRNRLQAVLRTSLCM